MTTLSSLIAVIGIIMISNVRSLPETCPEAAGIITDCRHDPNNIKCTSDQDCDANQRCCSYGCGGRTACFTKKSDSELPLCWQSMNRGTACPYRRYPQIRWYYDKPSRKCVPFKFTGCGGNKNNFVSSLDCMQECMMKYVPDQPIGPIGRPNPWDPPIVQV